MFDILPGKIDWLNDGTDNTVSETISKDKAIDDMIDTKTERIALRTLCYSDGLKTACTSLWSTSRPMCWQARNCPKLNLVVFSSV